MFPVAQHAEAPEALALHVEIMLGVILAGRAEFRHAHGLVVELLLLDDGGFDGHAVVIPARGVGGVEA